MSTPAPVIPVVKDEFRLIPIAQLHESPSNPRRHFDAKAMEELTESIRQQGVVQPIVVRPSRKTKLSLDNGDLVLTFEIVTGARRHRASKAAGRDTVPAIVRQLSDAQVIEIQMVENLQREDIHPLDEAQGYQTLIDKTGMEVPAIAGKVGKSESYVYQRLKLLALTDKAQKAFLAEKISAGHAILIARLQPADQAEALRECTQGYRSTSVRDLIDWIERNVHMDLHSAPFNKDDAWLLPEAGACVSCPKRTGFQPALFPDIAKKDTCTDRQCFGAKLEAHGQKRLAELKEKGEDVVKIVDYNVGAKPKGVLTSDQYEKAGNTKCPDTKIGMIAKGHEIGKTMKVCTNPKCKIHFGQAAREARSITQTGRNLAQERKHKAGKQAREETIVIIATDTTKIELADLKMLAEALIVEMWHEEVKKLFKRRGWEPKQKGYNTDYRSVAHDRIADMPPREIAGLLMECTLRSRLCPDNDDLAKVAKRSGVDFYKLERKALDALTERDRAKREKEKQRAGDKAEAKPKPGICQYCGCTETTPCDVGVEGACAWVDKPHTVCSNPKCLRKYNADKAKAKKPKGKS